MNSKLLYDNNLTEYGIFIACGLVLGCTLYYIIRSNYTAIPTKNLEPLTHEEIETIITENMEPISNANIDQFITDSDFETDIATDSQSTFGSDSTSDMENILDDPNMFFMPNVDFDVCPIEELKFFELSSLYHREIIEHSITDEELMDFITFFSKEDLCTNWINDVFLYVLTQL